MSDNSVNLSFGSNFYCFCGVPAPLMRSWTDDNPGRRFVGCGNYKMKPCKFFDWVDEKKSHKDRVYQFYSECQQLKIKMANMSVVMKEMEDKKMEMEDKKMEIENKLKREECDKLVWMQKFEEMKEKNMKMKLLVFVLVIMLLITFFFSRFN